MFSSLRAHFDLFEMFTSIPFNIDRKPAEKEKYSITYTELSYILTMLLPMEIDALVCVGECYFLPDRILHRFSKKCPLVKELLLPN